MYTARLLLRAAILVFCIATGLVWLLPSKLPAMPASSGSHISPFARPALLRINAAGTYAATVLARPLFTQSRKPPFEKATPGSETDDLPRLSGIMIIGPQRHAIFEGGGKSKVTAIGDQLGEFRILAIMPSAVRVDGPHGVELVSLAFDANRRTVITPAFSGPGLLERFRSQRPPSLPPPPPPTMQQMMAHLPKPHG